MKLFQTIALVLLAATAAFSQAPPADSSALDDRPIATVLGDTVTAKNWGQMVSIIFGTLLDRFAKENKLAPTQAELDTFLVEMEVKRRENLRDMDRERASYMKSLKFDSLSAEEREEKENALKNLEDFRSKMLEMEKKRKEGGAEYKKMEHESATDIVRTWKIYSALHAKYGGRVIFQDGGPEPVDAFRAFLLDQQKKGTFRIIDTSYAPAFWNYFVNEEIHSYYSDEEGEKLMKIPWWMMETPTK